jgi:hypothetical protein
MGRLRQGALATQARGAWVLVSQARGAWVLASQAREARGLLVTAALLSLSLAVPPAVAAKTFGGIIRDVPSGYKVRSHNSSAIAHTANLPYNGGAVLHSNRTHVIFWAPESSGLGFEPGYQSMIEVFLANVAADSRAPTNVYGLTGQYTDALGPAVYNSRYGGAVLDTDQLPPNGCTEPPVTGPGWTVCLTDSQLEAEIEHVVRVDHLPNNGTDVYFLLTPNGFGSCTDASSTSCALGGPVSGYCGYHSQTTTQQVLYAVIPYNAVAGHCQSDNPRPNGSTADPTISTVSHEHSEMVTDPFGDAWVEATSGNEDGDLCLTNFGPNVGGSGGGAWNEVIHRGRYYLQEEWSNEDNSCQPRDEADQISFSRPARATAGKRIRIVAHGRDRDGWIATFQWFFGDRRTGRGRVVSHTFRRPGRYRVVLRTTDKAGNWAFYAVAVRVSKARRRR